MQDSSLKLISNLTQTPQAQFVSSTP